MMENLTSFTEKEFPIEKKWLIKVCIFLWLVITLVFFREIFHTSFREHGNFKFFLLFSIVPWFILAPWWIWATVKNFHYEFGETLIILKQGIFGKSERTIPYGRIQNISLSQGPIDRFLGLSTMIIENAADSGGAKILQSKKKPQSNLIYLGFNSNRITIPGLLNKNALILKEKILQLMKDNPIDDAQSGL